jgi:hypothetical protein
VLLQIEYTVTEACKLPTSLGARCVKLTTILVRVVFMKFSDFSSVKPFTVVGVKFTVVSAVLYAVKPLPRIVILGESEDKFKVVSRLILGLISFNVATRSSFDCEPSPVDHTCDTLRTANRREFAFDKLSRPPCGVRCVNEMTTDVMEDLEASPFTSGAELAVLNATVFTLVLDASNPVPFIVIRYASVFKVEVSSFNVGFTAVTLATTTESLSDQLCDTVALRLTLPAFVGAK